MPFAIDTFLEGIILHPFSRYSAEKGIMQTAKVVLDCHYV